MEKKLYGVLMAFGATEAAMNNDDSFKNGKNNEKKYQKKNPKKSDNFYRK